MIDKFEIDNEMGKLAVYIHRCMWIVIRSNLEKNNTIDLL